MRKIKFRIWDNEAKVFRDGTESSLHAASNWFINPFDGSVSDFITEVGEEGFYQAEDPGFYREGTKTIKSPRYILQQFIGLIDINNKEIYEGDLVSFIVPGITHGPEKEEFANMEVFFDEEIGAFSFRYFPIKDEYSYSVLADRIDTESFEVTGNIFEGIK